MTFSCYKYLLLFFLVIIIHSQPFSQSVLIQGGSFVMGSTENEAEADERPTHEVILSGFKIGKFEVTFSQYDSCIHSGACTPAHYDDGECLAWNGNRFKSVIIPQEYRNPDYPVVCVTWHQAFAYCRSKGMRLPSEAQWEYAARAGTDSKYFWGNETPSKDQCAFNGKPQVVGSSEANRWGLHDMTGNAWEWTSDFYDKQYYSFMGKQDPKGPDAGFYRVVRGGGFYSGTAQLRIANRHWFSPDFSEISLGFRCAR